MEKMQYLELFTADPTVSVETQLVNRLDTSIDELIGTTAEKKRVTGIASHKKTASTGYLIIRKNGVTVTTLDLRSLHGMTDVIPLDLLLEAADHLSVWVVDTEDALADLGVILQYVPV